MAKTHAHRPPLPPPPPAQRLVHPGAGPELLFPHTKTALCGQEHESWLYSEIITLTVTNKNAHKYTHTAAEWKPNSTLNPHIYSVQLKICPPEQDEDSVRHFQYLYNGRIPERKGGEDLGQKEYNIPE